MTRLNLVLLVAVLASALYLVHTQYQSRRLFAELERAHAEARRIELDNERLQVEKRAQATPLRVEKLAKEQLQMRTATPAITQYVTYAEPAATPAPAQAEPARSGAAASASGASRQGAVR
jgi:cell division protein FtsL